MSGSHSRIVFARAKARGVDVAAGLGLTAGEGTQRELGCARPPPAPNTLLYVSLPPFRLLDTRPGAVAAGGTLATSNAQTLAQPALVLNVTVAGASAPGYLTVYPDGVPRPTASNLNFTSGITVANLVITMTGPHGDTDFFNGSTGGLPLVIDMEGAARVVVTANPRVAVAGPRPAPDPWRDVRAVAPPAVLDRPIQPGPARVVSIS